MSGFWFEDVEIGQKQRFGHYEVTREEVLDFARKYDPQPFHLSDEAAAKTHFGRAAASGWHTASMAMAMNVEAIQAHPGLQEASLGAAGLENLRWIRPVYPGDVLRCERESLEKRELKSRSDAGLVKQQMTVFNQDDEPVMQFTAIVLLRRRPQD